MMYDSVLRAMLKNLVEISCPWEFQLLFSCGEVGYWIKKLLQG